MFKFMINLLCTTIFAVSLAACTATSVPTVPDQGGGGTAVQQNPSLRIAVLDHHLLGDLSDPAVMAKYARADLLITQPNLFWGRPELARNMELLRAANPNMKIVGFFRSKCIRLDWAVLERSQQTFLYDLYHEALPFLSYTTTGDTLQDWPGVVLFDFTQPAARKAMLDVFARHQAESSAKLDGVYWDYFNTSLWISPDVTTMSGDPDMDGDGVNHYQDADELAAFNRAQVDWIEEMRDRMGTHFIQIANGGRALRDSTFAGLLDGMNYEIFPHVGFGGATPYRDALNPAVPYNLWAAHDWLRTENGGPWQILENVWIPYVVDQNQTMRALDLGDMHRALALLTDATVIHYDLTGQHHAGLPSVEVELGAPLGGVTIMGDVYTRAFERGTVTFNMGTGRYPMGYSFRIDTGDQEVVQEISSGYIYP